MCVHTCLSLCVPACAPPVDGPMTTAAQICSVPILGLSDAHSLSLATSVKYSSSLNKALPTQLTARHSFYLHLKKKQVDDSNMPAF